MQGAISPTGDNSIALVSSSSGSQLTTGTLTARHGYVCHFKGTRNLCM